VGTISAVILVLTALGGAAGVASLVKAWSDRRIAPRSVAIEEVDGALRVLGNTIDRLEAQLVHDRKECVAELLKFRKESALEIGYLRAENVELRAEVKQLRKELHS
jgi:hypothetical protein